MFTSGCRISYVLVCLLCFFYVSNVHVVPNERSAAPISAGTHGVYAPDLFKKRKIHSNKYAHAAQHNVLIGCEIMKKRRSMQS